MLFEPHHPRLAQARSRSGGGPLLDRQTFVLVCGSSVLCRHGAVLSPVTFCVPPASLARLCLGLPRHRHGDGRPFRDTKSPPTVVNSTTSTEEA
jgi:hypothetical protein